jgi:hypothetical protein
MLIKVEGPESFEVEIWPEPTAHLLTKRSATRFPHRRHLRKYSDMRSEDELGEGRE